MRLFTAIDLPRPALLRMERLLSALRGEAQLNWSPIDNLHITTKFIGEWPESRLDELTEELRFLPKEGPLQIRLQRLGWFPNEGSPRVLYVSVDGDSGLLGLAARTAECLEKLGLKKEDRPYSPHLTLARVKNPVPLGRLKQRIAELQPNGFATFEVNSYSLYRSDPGSNASVYRKLMDFRLEAAMTAS